MTASSATKMGRTSDHQQKDSVSLLSTQRTELIGELAQAMANHFNNVMMAVTGYAELELKKASTKDRRALEQVLTNATRATSLIQMLLEFSRKHTPAPRQLELNAVISDISELLKELLGERMELVSRLDANGTTIYADPIDIQQSLLGLVVLARNAAAGSGQLTISTSNTDLDQKAVKTEDQAEPGKYVALCVEVSQGSASAGSAVNGTLNQTAKVSSSLDAIGAAIKNCRGILRVSNEVGAQSQFKLYFPASKNESANELVPVSSRKAATARTILVVEDDDSVRVPAAEFLMMEGFKVLQARTGSEAMSVVQQSRSPLDVLISDIFMPKMNGHEVAAKLLEQHPDLKVLYMSGDPGRQGSAETYKIPQDATLRKPFRLQVLRDKIRDLLGE
jgi:two-component system, cell cycle sensor histidine kinase and response regulator CckA